MCKQNVTPYDVYVHCTALITLAKVNGIGFCNMNHIQCCFIIFREANTCNSHLITQILFSIKMQINTSFKYEMDYVDIFNNNN